MRRTLAVTIVSLALFVAVAVRVTQDAVPWLDARILRLVPPADEPDSLSRVCNAFVVAGIALVIVVVSAVAIALILRRRWRAALFWCLTFAGLLTLDVVLKPLFDRPSISSGEYSFPSGNAMASIALLLGTTNLMSRKSRGLYAAGGVLVGAYGCALVYLSWHYPSDIVGGWLLAIAWIGLLNLVVRPPQVFESRSLEIRRARKPRLPSADAQNRLSLREE